MNLIKYRAKTIIMPLAKLRPVFLVFLMAIFLLTSLIPLLNVQASNVEAIKLIQSHRNIFLQPGQAFTFQVGYKNTSNFTWTKDGKNRVAIQMLDTSKTSNFYHKFWRDKNTPAYLMDDSTAPGAIGYFRFALQAPSEYGFYKEKFILVNGNNSLNGSVLELEMEVTGAKPVQAAKAVNKTATSTNSAGPKASNIPAPTSTTIDKNFCENLGRSVYSITVSQQIKDECYKLINSQNESTTPVTIPTNTSTPTPTNTPADNSTPVTTPATPAVDQDDLSLMGLYGQLPVDGPTIRVGIIHIDEAPVSIKIKSAQSYQVVTENNQVIASALPNQETEVNYDFTTKAYTINVGTNKVKTPNYPRFVQANSKTVPFEITSYENRPSWNKSINYNRFIGVMEVRYNSSKDRVWLINELQLEDYLKGIAETTNYSPDEYQKSLITAARTYAMYHYLRGTKHGSEYFTVDDLYDQVYKGYSSQVILTKVVSAVEATKGQIVTYENELAITPYFSHSDGRTRDWAEVWYGDVPWCKSVKEPEGFDKDYMYGHGVGLSARGAIILDADHGYTWKEILKYYYTGVNINKVY